MRTKPAYRRALAVVASQEYYIVAYLTIVGGIQNITACIILVLTSKALPVGTKPLSLLSTVVTKYEYNYNMNIIIGSGYKVSRSMVVLLS